MPPIVWTTDYEWGAGTVHIGTGGPGENYKIFQRNGVWVLWGIGSYRDTITDLEELKQLAELSRK